MSEAGFWATSWTSPWPTILAASLVSYLIRVSGYWLIGRVTLGPRLRRALEALPGSIFVASVLPIAARGGVAGAAACIAAAGLMFVTRREALAIFGGLAAAAGARALGF